MDGKFTEQADALLAVAGETTNAELIAAASSLREVAVECDALDVRFHAACARVKALLVAA